jgi:iron complex transport system ATP-binding protein
MSALEAVLVGRHPHLAPWQWNGVRDLDIALAAPPSPRGPLARARPLPSLSGGEQRRVAIAALLAQDPPIVLLDEPTNHLDPNQALEVLDLFRERCRAGGTVFATLHDPTLAARYADRVLLLFGDGRWIDGPAREHLTATQLSEIYGVSMAETRVGERRVFFAS